MSSPGRLRAGAVILGDSVYDPSTVVLLAVDEVGLSGASLPRGSLECAICIEHQLEECSLTYSDQGQLQCRFERPGMTFISESIGERLRICANQQRSVYLI